MKSRVTYESGFDEEQKLIGVTIYSCQPSKDGTHISTSCFFNASSLKRLSNKNIDSLIINMEASIDRCIEEVIRRKELEKLNEN
jgi:hypothetical protein